MTHEHGHHHSFDGGFAERLRLDARVFADMHAEMADWVVEHAGPVERIVDLGAGIGTGALALLERLPGATALAVDSSPELLDQVAPDDRLLTEVVDLDGAWPELGRVDLVWMADALHHMADPVSVLSRAGSLGGLVAVAEMAGAPRWLADSPLEERLHALLDADRLERAPAFGSDWPAAIAAAGLEVVDQRVFTADPSPRPGVVESARDSFARARDRLGDRLDDEDRAELDRLLADLESAPLQVGFRRTVLLARMAS